MAVARHAPCKRISGESSAGDATTTARAKPAGPRVSSINSWTSRPRSPIKPTTTTSASVYWVIRPSKVLLPTPLPANRPSRWPRPTVNKALMARIPTSRGSVISARRRGFTAWPWRAVCPASTGLSPSSSGLPAPSITRPTSPSPTATSVSPATGVTSAFGVKPCTEPIGIRNKRPSPKPTTSASTVAPVAAVIWQRLPMAA